MLKSIGFWPEKYDEYHPPLFLVDAAFDESNCKKITEYLTQGEELFAWLGFSHCRFRCEVENDEMGCRDLTDGEWVWPEGFSHYIQNHKLSLPIDFIEHIKSRNYDASIPERLRSKINELKDHIDNFGSTNFDHSIWNNWLKTKGEENHFFNAPIGKQSSFTSEKFNLSIDDLFRIN